MIHELCRIRDTLLPNLEVLPILKQLAYVEVYGSRRPDLHCIYNLPSDQASKYIQLSYFWYTYQIYNILLDRAILRLEVSQTHTL